ncbi:MAG: hypothetical protein ACKOWC_08910 [Limnohabitans sp.]
MSTLNPSRHALVGLLVLGVAAGPVLAASSAAPAMASIPRPPHVTAALSKALAVWDRERAVDARKCRQEAARNSRQASYRLRYRTVLQQQSALHALQYDVFADCGGPYPTVQARGVAFEVATGARYHPARLYRIGQPSRQAFEGFVSSLSPAVGELVRARLLDAGRAECEDVIRLAPLERAESLSLGQNGLHVHVSAAQAVQACFPPVELPYDLIREHLDPVQAVRLGWRQ